MFSVLGIILFFALLIALPVHFLIMRKKVSDLKQTVLGAYYDGLKATNFLRTTYYGAFLLRRLLHAIIIFATYKMNSLVGIVCFDAV